MLDEHDIDIIRVEIDEGDQLPDWRDVGSGGGDGRSDERQRRSRPPWLAGEKAWIAAAVRAGTPYFGACLGAQLLAASLGATVRSGDSPEVGVLPVTLTPEGLADPVMSRLGASFDALQWHGDTFDLPAAAVHLGRSPAYDMQAFRAGRAYAVHFISKSPGRCSRSGARCRHMSRSLRATLGDTGLDVLSRAFDAAHEAMTNAARLLFESWVCAARQRDRRRSSEPGDGGGHGRRGA